MKKDKKKRKKKDGKRRKSARAAPSGRAIARARDAVTRAGQALEERLAAFQGVADGIEQAATERFRALAVRELRDDQLVRDLADLQAALAAHPGRLPGDLEPFRHLPEALLRWLQRRFGLAPHLEAGRVMEVPSEKLDGFAIAGDRGEAPDGVLVRLRVLAPGWKRGAEVVVPPRAEVIPG
jgi:hypothetical protein